MQEATLDLLDAAPGGRVLVYGSLPPEGRDVDLLVREADLRPLELALAGAGFSGRDGLWARFAGCTASAVELTPAETWRLPPAALAELFEQAVPLDGWSRLARPAPHHTLLILAGRPGGLGERQRRRLEAALAEDPAAWTRARERARAWRVEASLAALASPEAARRPLARRSAGAARRLLAAARGGTVVCLSGLDGAGKSSQAAALRDALAAVGIDAAVEWLPLGQNATVERLSALARSLLRLLRGLRPLGELERRTARGESLVAAPGADVQRAAGARAVLFAWATLVALANALHQRRVVTAHALAGRAVVFDRYTLDSIVRLRYLYGDRERFRFQAALIEALSPRPAAAFLLELRPETALARKEDRWSLADLRRQADLYREEAARLGVPVLDGERPREELCEEIAATVWSALG